MTGSRLRRRALLAVGLMLVSFGWAPPLAATQTEGGVPTSDGAWTWQNPQPQGNRINALQFMDADTGWAVGQGGLILRTTDGGQSWATQTSGTRADLTGMAILDEARAVIVGNTGTILTTDDAGATWASHGDAASVDLRGVVAPGDDYVYAVGRAGILPYSPDGGTTWHGWGIFEGNRELLRVQFLNPQRGFVLTPLRTGGMSVYTTPDGGPTWYEIGIPTTVNVHDFRVVAQDTMVVVGANGAILKTTDSGASWRTIPSPTNATLQRITSVGALLEVVGDGGVILRSTDTGDSWARLPDSPTTENLVDVLMVKPQVGYAAGAHGTLLKTTNGGNSWLRLDRGERAELRGLDFATSQVGLAVGTGGTILKTLDQGATWRHMASGVSVDLNDVRFLDRQTSVAVGANGTILLSRDAGETWSLVLVQATADLHAVAVVPDVATDAPIGFMTVGYREDQPPTVLRSEDQGRSWQGVVIPSAGSIASDRPVAVAFPDRHAGFIGSASAVWASADGGRSWQIVAGPSLRSNISGLRGFAFVSASEGYAVGTGAFHTTNGGRTWAQSGSSAMGSRALWDVAFRDPSNGYAVGNGGVVFTTADGGMSWTELNTGTRLNLRSVRFISPAVGFVIGEGGVILASTSGGQATRGVPPAVISMTPADGRADVPAADALTVQFTKAVGFDPSDYGEVGAYQLRGPDGALVPAKASYEPVAHLVQIAPVEALEPGSNYALTVVGGPTGVMDLDGQPMAFDRTARFRVACAISPRGGFGALVATNAPISQHLGCPLAPEAGGTFAEQTFERGHMLWLADRQEILVVTFPDNHWTTYPDRYVAGSPDPTDVPPVGLVTPRRGFGMVWSQTPGLREQLGFALAPERGFDGALQELSNGRLVWTGADDGQIRIYYRDGSAAVVPDPTRGQ